MSDKKDRKKYLFKNTIIFALGTIATKVITFLLLPLYTTKLTTVEYGTIDLVSTISTVLVPILLLNIAESVMRFSLDEEKRYIEILTVGIVVMLLAMVLGFFIIPITNRIPLLADYSVYIYLYILSTGVCHVFLYYLRGKELLIQYSIGNILLSVSTALLNVVFLVTLNKGIEGYFSAFILAHILTTFYVIICGKVWEVCRFWHFDVILAKQMIVYSVVLIPNSFMWWIMNSSDRIMITALVGVDANAVYAISYKVPSLIATFTAVFNTAWSYSAIREEKSTDRDLYSNSVYSRLIDVVLFMGGTMILLIKPFLAVYVSELYNEAWRYTSFLIIGFVFYALGSFLSTPYTVHKDSKGFLFSGICGAIVNVILNFIFIPIMGIMGAAFATCISYFTVFAYRAKDTRKYVKLTTVTKHHISGFALIIAMAITLILDLTISPMLLLGEYIGVMIIIRKTIFEMILSKLKVRK